MALVRENAEMLLLRRTEGPGRPKTSKWMQDAENIIFDTEIVQRLEPCNASPGLGQHSLIECFCG